MKAKAKLATKRKPPARARKRAVVPAATAAEDIAQLRNDFDRHAETLSAKLGGAVTADGVRFIVGSLMATLTPHAVKTKLRTEAGREVPMTGTQIRELGSSMFTRALIPIAVSGMFQTPTPPPAAEDLVDIGKWFDHGKQDGATHMLVVLDTVTQKNRPVYAKPGESARTLYRHIQWKASQRVTAVYALGEDRATQLAEWRPMHVD